RGSGTNQKINLTFVAISLCSHPFLLKFMLLNPPISTTKSTALQTHAHFSKHSTLSSVPLHHHPPHPLLLIILLHFSLTKHLPSAV
ncbi:hypothetical protein ABG768_028211, partial [Culter alburnus]